VDFSDQKSAEDHRSSVEWIALEELNIVCEGDPGNNIDHDDRGSISTNAKFINPAHERDSKCKKKKNGDETQRLDGMDRMKKQRLRRETYL
jgi:hypothetical protein